MARLTFYGHVPPSEFLAMEWEVALELAGRVENLFIEAENERSKFDLELAKATARVG